MNFDRSFRFFIFFSTIFLGSLFKMDAMSSSSACASSALTVEDICALKVEIEQRKKLVKDFCNDSNMETKEVIIF